MQLTLTRFAYLPECTLGRLAVGSKTFATIERPWIHNAAGLGGTPRESCVPDGIYDVRPHSSEKFEDVYAIVNPSLGVYYQELPAANRGWGRTAILIHAGNFVTDVVGCVAIGLQHGGYNSVVKSRDALDQLRAALGHSWHSIQIVAAGTV